MGKDSKYQIEGERPLRTPPGDWDKFLKSPMWSDLNYTIKDRIDILTDRLVQSETTEELIGLKHEIKAWKEMLGLAAYLKSCAEEELKSNQENNEE